MKTRDEIEQIIADYLYTKDDVLDLNAVDSIASELAEKIA